MKITAVSDLHGNLPTLPKCDLLVIAGDICPDTPNTLRDRQKCAAEQAEWLKGEFVPWLHGQDFTFCVYIWGNHDFVGEHPYMTPESLASPERDIRLLQSSGRAIQVGDELIRIWGAPWVGNIPMWAFNLPQHELTQRWQYIPEALDILITHAPPYGTGDFCRGYGPVGDPGLAKRLTELRAVGMGPAIHLFGHIHEGRGVYNNETYNLSYVDSNYKPYPLDIVTIEYSNEIFATV